MGHDKTHFRRSIRRLSTVTLIALALACGRAESIQSALVNAGGEAGAAPSEVSGSPTGDGMSSGGHGGSPVTATNAASGSTVSTTGTGGSDGSDGGDRSSGGQGGEAGAPACSPDPRCDGKPPGKSCLGHALTTCEDLDDDGCVDFDQLNCAPGTCLDESSTCSEGLAGETCEDAIQVLHSGFVLSGSDFTESFGSDFDLAEHPGCDFGETESADAVFAIALQAGEVLSVHQQGALESVVALTTSCVSQSLCIDSATGGSDLALEHTAASDETVYAIVTSFLAAPAATDYEIRFDIDSACGNGTLEGGEGCDDENRLDGDGCSATCSVEFPFQCSETSPSACSLPPSLGTADGDDVLSLPWPDRFAQGDTLYYTVTFTEDALVDVLATSNSGETGDINVLFYSDWDVFTLPGIRTGNEDWPKFPFQAGTYLLEILAGETLPDGFHLKLTVHDVSCGDGEVAAELEACDRGPLGQAGCDDCQVVFGWVCSGSPSVCEEFPRIGSEPFDAGDPIEPVYEEDSVASYVPQYWLIEFNEDVVLSGSTAPNGETDAFFDYIVVWNESGMVENFYDGTGGFADLHLAPGRYVIELQTFYFAGLPDGFTFTLQTVAPDP